MSRRQLSDRLSRIEVTSRRVALVTREESHVASLILSMAIAESQRPREICERARLTAEKLEAMIVSTAKSQRTEHYMRYIEKIVRPGWEARTGCIDYLSPVVGRDHDDWEVPDLFRRRLAIRRCPTVIALIGEPDPSLPIVPDQDAGLRTAVRQLFERAGIQVRRSVARSAKQ